MEITIILPCAGEGSRLNLGYPKELYEIQKNKRLIDFSLNQIKKIIKNGNHKIQVSVVITESKEDVYNYVKSKLNNIIVNKVYFNNAFKEWPGSVYSAKDTFSKFNIVLLPDTCFTITEDSKDIKFSIVELILEGLESNDAVFCYIKTNCIEKLKKLGAMYVKDNKIIRFKDKPKEDFYKFNSFWALYAFKKDSAENLYNFLHKSVFSDKKEILKPTFPIGGIEINSFNDLGTWKNIEEFLLSETNSCSSIPGKT